MRTLCVTLILAIYGVVAFMYGYTYRDTRIGSGLDSEIGIVEYGEVYHKYTNGRDYNYKFAVNYALRDSKITQGEYKTLPLLEYEIPTLLKRKAQVKGD